MLSFKSYFITNLGFQFYMGLYVNSEVMSGALFAAPVYHKAFFLNLLCFYRRKKLNSHNSSTIMQQKTPVLFRKSILCHMQKSL